VDVEERRRGGVGVFRQARSPQNPIHIVADYRAAEVPSVSAFRDAGTLASSLVRLLPLNPFFEPQEASRG
jgi:hypothetical protein